MSWERSGSYPSAHGLQILNGDSMTTTIRKIDTIILHCTGSDNPVGNKFENVRAFHMAPLTKPIWWSGTWRKGRGFKDIAYHFYLDRFGKCHNGRRVEVVGAHCEGYNHHSIGICLAGDKVFYPEQYAELKTLVTRLCLLFQLDPRKDVVGHELLDLKGKTCPNFDWRAWIKKEYPDV